MSLAASQSAGRRLLGGSLQMFLADAIALPTGLLTAAFLGRQLSPAGYGLYTLSTVIVAWIEWSLVGLFGRAVIKAVGGATDWRPIGNRTFRLYLTWGAAAGLALALLSGPLARLFHEPVLGSYLRLHALEIPIFCAAQAHRVLLVGRGHYGAPAVAGAARWLCRLVFIVVCVQAGLSVPGAILGSIGAPLVELFLCRLHVRPSLRALPSAESARAFVGAAPLFLSAIGVRLFDKLDLLMLKHLGATATVVGLYGASQSVAVVLALFAGSVSPLLLSTLSRLEHAGDRAAARAIARNALRAILCLAPPTAVLAGAGPQVVRALFGAPFEPAAAFLPAILFAALALALLSVATAVLIAAGRPGLTLVVAGPMLFAAFVGYVLVIPRFGAAGSALTALVVAAAGAATAVVLVQRAWQVPLPLGTAVRSALVAAACGGLAAWWPASGAWLLLKLPLLVAFGFLALAGSGELTPAERSSLKSLLLRLRRRAPSNA